MKLPKPLELLLALGLITLMGAWYWRRKPMDGIERTFRDENGRDVDIYGSEVKSDLPRKEKAR